MANLSPSARTRRKEQSARLGKGSRKRRGRRRVHREDRTTEFLLQVNGELFDSRTRLENVLPSKGFYVRYGHGHTLHDRTRVRRPLQRLPRHAGNEVLANKRLSGTRRRCGDTRHGYLSDVATTHRTDENGNVCNVNSDRLPSRLRRLRLYAGKLARRTP